MILPPSPIALRFRRRRLASALAATLLVASFLLGCPAVTRAADVPEELQVKILLTALGFNRTLAASPDYSIVIGVYGECPTYDALLLAQTKKINGKSVSVIKTEELTYASLERNGIHVVYVCKIGDAEAKILGKAAPRLGVVVLADEPELVSTVALMGVKEKGGRPRLQLNMKVARETKIDLDPRILGAAEIVEE